MKGVEEVPSKADIMLHPVAVYFTLTRKKFNPIPAVSAMIADDIVKGCLRSDKWYRFAIFALWTVWDDAAAGKKTPDDEYVSLYNKQGNSDLGESSCKKEAEKYLQSHKHDFATLTEDVIFQEITDSFFKTSKTDCRVLLVAFCVSMGIVLIGETSGIIPKKSILAGALEILFVIVFTWGFSVLIFSLLNTIAKVRTQRNSHN